ncbi:tetratricopeptide repeat protein [Paludisphaera rhizosphaerae]|uniref:hypothetical protein n=1 Tax=Paludisphaera rhizosphaerae TaxID=2711216 RepID=UPI0013EE12A2|nr:hypothetical protein [Paludisphaera rhizosphaerae]
MQIFIPLALIGWIPACLVLFLLFPWRRALQIAIIVSWLFLPSAGLNISGLPDYTKTSAFSYGIILSLMILVPDRFARLKPSWMDLPTSIFVLCPIVTSLANDLGLYDGVASANGNLTYIGLPYLIGRACFDSARDIRNLGVAIAVGGLIYVPLCLLEMAVGPFLSVKIYTIYAHTEVRLGGFRPRVFLNTGLELGLWMAIACFISIWLWRVGVLKRVMGIPFGSILLPILIVTTLLCRSSGATFLLGFTLSILWLSARMNRRVLMVLWTLACFAYIGVRVGNYWDYNGLITFLAKNFSEDRAQSLEFRFQNEDILIAKAVQRPVFGWGGFGRSRVMDEYGRDISITDGLWIIMFGVFGTVGVLSFLMISVLPCLVFIRKFPARRWFEPDVGSLAALVGSITLYLGDIMFNGFSIMPILVGAGALSSVLRLPTVYFSDGADFTDAFSRDLPGTTPLELAPAEEKMAARYIDLARGFRQSGDFESAAGARRHAYDLLAGLADSGRETPSGRRRRLDCANDLAWLLAVRPDPAPSDREEAVDLARMATEGDPNSPTYWNTLGLSLCRVGAFEDAQAAARRSMELDEAWNGFDLVVLALTDARLGRKADAAPWLAQAVRWRDDQGASDPVLDELIHETESALAG